METDLAKVTANGKNKLQNDGQCRKARRNHAQLGCKCQTTRAESMAESPKTSSMLIIGTKGDNDKCGVDKPTLSAS